MDTSNEIRYNDERYLYYYVARTMIFFPAVFQFNCLKFLMNRNFTYGLKAVKHFMPGFRSQGKLAECTHR